MDQELLNAVNDTAAKAREAENTGKSERTCAKYWNAHFRAVDAYKAQMGRGRA